VREWLHVAHPNAGLQKEALRRELSSQIGVGWRANDINIGGDIVSNKLVSKNNIVNKDCY
jgi:hypothetical protein